MDKVEQAIKMLEKQKRTLERRIARNKETIKDYEDREDNLSEHGHKQHGFYRGTVLQMENDLDDVNDLLDILRS